MGHAQQASEQARGLWDTLNVHVADYRAIRQAQANLMRRVLRDQAAADLRIAGEFRGLPAVWPDWRPPVATRPGSRRQTPPPWGESVETGEHAQTAFLAWVAVQDAPVLWVPTIGDLVAVADEVRRGGRPIVSMFDAYGQDITERAQRHRIGKARAREEALGRHPGRSSNVPAVATGDVPVDF